METTTLMLDLKDHEIGALLRLCRCDLAGPLALGCDTPEQLLALSSALHEIAWQLACLGHEGAIETLANREVE